MSRPCLVVLGLIFPLCCAAFSGCSPEPRDDGTNDADADGDGDTDSDTNEVDDTDSGTDPLDCAGGRYDSSTGLCWQHPIDNTERDWWEAVAYCDNLDLGDYTNWYLPSREQVIGLLDDCSDRVVGGGGGLCNSCSESSTCLELFGPDENGYWSSSATSDYRAWGVGFAYGGVSDTDKTYAQHVRCVRH
jgi:hypothetical protein